MKEITINRIAQGHSDLLSEVMGHARKAGLVLLGTSEDTFTIEGSYIKC